MAKSDKKSTPDLETLREWVANCDPFSPVDPESYERVNSIIPAVKVVERGVEPVPFRAGIDALSKLVGLRVPVDRIFGERRDLLEKLIISSGGHVPTLIVFIRELVYGARNLGLPVTEEHIERAIQGFREQLLMNIWRDSVPLLHRILLEGEIKDLSREEHTLLARAMDSYIVLCYRNGGSWHEIHPLARKRIQELAAARESREQQEGSAPT